MLLVLLILSILMFLIYNLIPNNRAYTDARNDMNSMKSALKGKSEAEKEAFFQQRYEEYQRQYGTDTKNQVVRYLRWIGLYPNYYGRFSGLLQGNFGYSYELKDEVLNVIKEPMKNTIFINVFATILALGITIPLGIKLAVKKGTKLDQTVQVLTLLGYSLPAFVICIVFIWISVIKPFHKLERFADSLAAGEFDEALDYQRTNYFGKFTWAFDSMRREIIKARSCEREAIENNKTVIASLSHDLKTPVASISAYSEARVAIIETRLMERIFLRV